MSDRVIITKPFHGICAMQVCAEKDATDEEILSLCNRENPSGTSLGWTQVARETFDEERARPVACADNPETRTHFLVILPGDLLMGLIERVAQMFTEGFGGIFICPDCGTRLTERNRQKVVEYPRGPRTYSVRVGYCRACRKDWPGAVDQS